MNNAQTDNAKYIDIVMPMYNLIEMPLINCEINLILTWSEGCVISSATGATKFKIRTRKVCVPVVTLSTQVNAKLLQQLKSGFERINWNKYQPKVSPEIQKSSKRQNLPKVEIKDSIVMTDGKKFSICQLNVI